MLSRVQLSATPWTVAHQTSLSMGFPRQEYWRGLPFPTPGDLPDSGIKPASVSFPALAGGFFTICVIWKAPYLFMKSYKMWILIIHQLLLYGEREIKKEGKEIKRHRVESDVMKFSIIQRHLRLSHRMPNVALTCWGVHGLMEKTSEKTQIVTKLCCCCLVSQSRPTLL